MTNSSSRLSIGSLLTLGAALVSLITAVVVAAFTMGSIVERIDTLEMQVKPLTTQQAAPVVFGKWELRQHSHAYEEDTDGFVIVRSHGDAGSAESDFEVFVDGDDGFRARTRGGKYHGAATPVPKGKRWEVRRGSSSNSGTMDVHWLPLLTRE